MAAKRAKKKTKRAKTKQANKPSLLWRLALLIALTIGGLSATYYFGSFELRTQMEHLAIKTIDTMRSPEQMPRPVVQLLNTAYDAIPESEGLVVEGGEIGHDDLPFIAGIPTSKHALRVLHNHSYINLFNEQERQAQCIAFKLDDKAKQPASDTKAPEEFFEDTRIKQLRASDMQAAQWSPTPIAPPSALAKEYGTEGGNEARLTTNLVPMDETFANGVWQRLIQELTEEYPRRFGEIWIYLGPVLRPESSKLSSGIPIPDGFYAIAFDLTEDGGLRAIAFIIPQDATELKLSTYLTTIKQIEQYTGLQFLPDLDYSAREGLENFQSPRIW